MQLTRERQDRAKTFIYEHARPLERRLFSYHFQGGAAEDVLAELAKYQNADGGFGRALEPDLRLPASSALATTVGLQILRELDAPADHPLVQGAIRYLLDTYDAEIEAWPIIPSNANSAPHAPWWLYDENLSEGWRGFLANPRAELVGYLWNHASLVPDDLLNKLTGAAISHLNAHPEMFTDNDLLCYRRLAETRALPEDTRTNILEGLGPIVDRLVARDPTTWEQYVLKPLRVATSPDSPFVDVLAMEVKANLDYEIERQDEDGSWAPNRTWDDNDPEVWPEAEREWRGVLTVKTLKLLRGFGRLE
jgi:hypothetical protein